MMMHALNDGDTNYSDREKKRMRLHGPTLSPSSRTHADADSNNTTTTAHDQVNYNNNSNSKINRLTAHSSSTTTALAPPSNPFSSLALTSAQSFSTYSFGATPQTVNTPISLPSISDDLECAESIDEVLEDDEDSDNDIVYPLTHSSDVVVRMQAGGEDANGSNSQQERAGANNNTDSVMHTLPSSSSTAANETTGADHDGLTTPVVPYTSTTIPSTSQHNISDGELSPSCYKSFEAKASLITSVEDALEAYDNNMELYMYDNEQIVQPYLFYFTYQYGLAEDMRPVLIQWLFDVGHQLNLMRETVYLGLNYIDRYLSLSPYDTPPCNDAFARIDKSKYQLLGITCLWIASKIEEIFPPTREEMIDIACQTYSSAEFERMEKIILQTLNWKLQAQTPVSFLKFYIKKSAHVLFEQFKLDAKLIFNKVNHRHGNHISNNNTAAANPAASSSANDTAAPSSSSSGSVDTPHTSVTVTTPNTSSSSSTSSPSSSASPSTLTPHQADQQFSMRQLEFLYRIEFLLSSEWFTRAMEFIDILTLSHHSMRFYPSHLAASALYLCHQGLHDIIPIATGYNVIELGPCLVLMNSLWEMDHLDPLDFNYDLLPEQLEELRKRNEQFLGVPYSEFYLKQNSEEDRGKWMNTMINKTSSQHYCNHTPEEHTYLQQQLQARKNRVATTPSPSPAAQLQHSLQQPQRDHRSQQQQHQAQRQNGSDTVMNGQTDPAVPSSSSSSSSSSSIATPSVPDEFIYCTQIPSWSHTNIFRSLPKFLTPDIWKQLISMNLIHPIKNKYVHVLPGMWCDDPNANPLRPPKMGIQSAYAVEEDRLGGTSSSSNSSSANGSRFPDGSPMTGVGGNGAGMIKPDVAAFHAAAIAVPRSNQHQYQHQYQYQQHQQHQHQLQQQQTRVLASANHGGADVRRNGTTVPRTLQNSFVNMNAANNSNQQQHQHQINQHQPPPQPQQSHQLHLARTQPIPHPMTSNSATVAASGVPPALSSSTSSAADTCHPHSHHNDSAPVLYTFGENLHSLSRASTVILPPAAPSSSSSSHAVGNTVAASASLSSSSSAASGSSAATATASLPPPSHISLPPLPPPINGHSTHSNLSNHSAATVQLTTMPHTRWEEDEEEEDDSKMDIVDETDQRQNVDEDDDDDDRLLAHHGRAHSLSGNVVVQSSSQPMPFNPPHSSDKQQLPPQQQPLSSPSE